MPIFIWNRHKPVLDKKPPEPDADDPPQALPMREKARQSEGSFGRLAVWLSAGIILSRVLGLARDMLTAWLLGTGMFADAFAVAMRLPNIMRRLFGEGTLSMTMTADLIRSGKNQVRYGVEKREDLGRRGFAWLIFLFVAAGELFAENLAWLLAPGLSGDALKETAMLLRICLPYVLFAHIAAMDMARLHAGKVFFASSASPALFNVIFIAFALGSFAFNSAEGQRPIAIALASGAFLGGCAQVLLQRLAMRGAGLTARPCLNKLDFLTWFRPENLLGGRLSFASFRPVLRLGAGIFGAAGLQLAMLCSLFGASWLPAGSVSALNYAERLVELPLSVTGAAIGMAGLPALAELAARGRHVDFAWSVSKAMKISLFVALPAMAGLMAVAENLVLAILAHGAFNEESALSTAVALCAYAVGLPAYALSRPLLAACNAQNDVLAPALSGFVVILFTIMAAFILIDVLPGAYSLAGPPFGAGVGLWAQTFMLWLTVKKKLAGQKARLELPVTDLVQYALGAALTFVAAYLPGLWIKSALPALALSVLLGISVYVLFLLFVGNKDMRDLREALLPSKKVLP